MRDRLVTPRFLIMCAYSFTVFVSLFQLLPTAPYHVIDLGGGTVAAGLFLGFLTFASALSAPFTGAIGDRVGQRHVLMTVSLVLAAFTASYALIRDYRLLLGVVIVHGLFWSGLLSASGAYMTSTLPPSRRAEGLGYWGLSSVLAIGAAPAIGFWVYRHGWAALCWELTTLNALMFVIAWRLPDDLHGAHGHDPAAPAVRGALRVQQFQVLGVHLGNHQRNGVEHAVVPRIAHDDVSRPGELGFDLAGNRGVEPREDQFRGSPRRGRFHNPGRHVIGQAIGKPPSCRVLERLAGGTLAGAKVGHLEPGMVREQRDELLTDHAGRAKDSYRN